MKPKRIVRPKEAWKKLGCGHSKFEEDYRFHTPDDPFVPGTNIPRVKGVPLGPRNVGFLEHELDALIEALAESGGHTESKAKNVKAARSSRVFLTDARPPKLGLADLREPAPAVPRTTRPAARKEKRSRAGRR